MSNKYILNKKGEPQLEPDLIKWAEWFETADRVLTKSEINGVTISTVFLGLDHAFNGGPPLIYETVILGSKRFEHHQWRYPTPEQALEGHRKAEELVSKGTSAQEGDK